MSDFDPFTQSITLASSDGSNVSVSLAEVDHINAESVSISISYGAQLGACFIMLIAVFVMTPLSKFLRPSNVLHVVGLLLSTIRMSLLAAFFPSRFNQFYAFWADDFSRVPRIDYEVSVAANTFTFLVVITIELALMNQAWTMVSLWPSTWKYIVSVLSFCVTLVTMGTRFALTIIHNQSLLNLRSGSYTWLIQAAIITNVVSICWFCALFNVKIVTHLITNRGLLPTTKGLNPMEILVITNGILMIIPVVFCGLQWGTYTNFEASSLTLTSVVIILPMGTLAAQRIAHSGGSFIYSSGAASAADRGFQGSINSRTPLKGSFSTASRGTGGPQVSLSSRCEAGMSSRDQLHPEDVEMGRVRSDYKMGSGQVHVQRNLEQYEERM